MKDRPFQRQLFLTFVSLLIAAQLVAQVVVVFTLREGKLAETKLFLQNAIDRIEARISTISDIQTVPNDLLYQYLMIPDSVHIFWFHSNRVPYHKTALTGSQTISSPVVTAATIHGNGFGFGLNPATSTHEIQISQRIILPNHDSTIVLASITTADYDNYFHSLLLSSVLIGILIALLLAQLAYYLARRIGAPLDTIRYNAVRYASGELSHRLPQFSEPLARVLAESLNRMAQQLEGRLHVETNQRNELEALLSSITEGVIAIDVKGEIKWLNRAAAELFQLDPTQATGRNFKDLIANETLQKYVGQALAGGGLIEETIDFQASEPIVLQAHGTQLFDSEARPIGAVIVLNDITRMEKLERVRSEFVANVSHELRTPITSIKGFVETLQEGAIDDKANAVRFLDIVRRQTDRLNSIVQDLLNLSRIEREGNKIERTNTTLFSLLQPIVQDYQARAQAQEIEIAFDCPKVIQIMVNQELFTQAVSNLLDNAIKYGGSGKRVELIAFRYETETIIQVRDYGAGIPSEHLGRLFERFYRVDTARSRSLGGTGLGLAIVKHIAQAHDGYVSVESELGKGTTFVIHLPL